MKSMTGYGFCELNEEKFSLKVEVKSYNNRYLDINHNIPYFLAPIEQEIDNKIKEICSRGHVDLIIRIKNTIENIAVTVDTGTAKSYLEAFKQIQNLSEGKISYTFSDLISQEGVIGAEHNDNADLYRESVMNALNKSLEMYNSSKEREGEATKKDLIRLENSLETSLEKVKTRAGDLEKLIKENLYSRFKEMLSDQAYDENRILAELAVMLVKYSINEEISRLTAHLDLFSSLVNSDVPVGRRLDFLCQEMNREINTIGSKSQIVEVNFEVVNMKDCLENIREQLRNIE